MSISEGQIEPIFKHNKKNIFSQYHKSQQSTNQQIKRIPNIIQHIKKCLKQEEIYCKYFNQTVSFQRVNTTQERNQNPVQNQQQQQQGSRQMSSISSVSQNEQIQQQKRPQKYSQYYYQKMFQYLNGKKYQQYYKEENSLQQYIQDYRFFVLEPKSYPFRPILKTQSGTCCLFNERFAVTAGHCIFQRNHKQKGSANRLLVTDLKVFLVQGNNFCLDQKIDPQGQQTSSLKCFKITENKKSINQKLICVLPKQVICNQDYKNQSDPKIARQHDFGLIIFSKRDSQIIKKNYRWLKITQKKFQFNLQQNPYLCKFGYPQDIYQGTSLVGDVIKNKYSIHDSPNIFTIQNIVMTRQSGGPLVLVDQENNCQIVGVISQSQNEDGVLNYIRLISQSQIIDILGTSVLIDKIQIKNTSYQNIISNLSSQKKFLRILQQLKITKCQASSWSDLMKQKQINKIIKDLSSLSLISVKISDKQIFEIFQTKNRQMYFSLSKFDFSQNDCEISKKTLKKIRQSEKYPILNEINLKHMKIEGGFKQFFNELKQDLDFIQKQKKNFEKKIQSRIKIFMTCLQQDLQQIQKLVKEVNQIDLKIQWIIQNQEKK